VSESREQRLTFRAFRLDQTENARAGSRFSWCAVVESTFWLVLGTPAAGLRARVKLETRITSNWYADAILRGVCKRHHPE